MVIFECILKKKIGRCVRETCSNATKRRHTLFLAQRAQGASKESKGTKRTAASCRTLWSSITSLSRTF